LLIKDKKLNNIFINFSNIENLLINLKFIPQFFKYPVNVFILNFDFLILSFKLLIDYFKKLILILIII